MFKKLIFRRDCVDGKRLYELYQKKELLAYSFTRQRSQGDELVVTFCHKDKTLMQLLEEGGAVHTLRYFAGGSPKLHQVGPFLDFNVTDFLDIWDVSVNGMLLLPEVSNASAIC